MAPRKPSDKELSAELVSTVNEVYKSSNREILSVNYVRQSVEEKLDLEDGFFKQDTWKTRSKQIIKEAVEKLEKYEDAPSSPAVAKPAATIKSPSGRKRASQDDTEQTPTPIKRQRTKTATSKPEKSETQVKKRDRNPKASLKKEESDLSGLGEDSELEKPVSKKARVQRGKPGPKNNKEESDMSEDDEDELKPVKTRVSRRKPAAKKSESELSEFSDLSDVSELPTTKRNLKRRGKSSRQAIVSDDEDEEDQEESDLGSVISEIHETPRKRTPRKPVAQEPEPKSMPPASRTESPLSEIKEDDSEAQADSKAPAAIEESDSEESIVFDEPPKPKRKRNTKEATAKPAAKAKAKATKPTSQLSPDEEEIKRLQGQLGKCGVRKIWAFVLKQYGDDTRAKIRHLKGMLKEVGMDGRFSEAKAREIKERRELQAELEAVQEMNDQWGNDGGRRASRSRAARPKKPLKIDSDDDDDDEEDGDGDGEEGKTASNNPGDDDDEEEDGQSQKRARVLAKRRADFAFLGDEDESD